MKTISITNHNGGVAKTATAINLAKGLANKGFKVLIIDADPQGTTTDTISGTGNEFTNEKKELIRKKIIDGCDRFSAFKDGLTSEDSMYDLSDVLENPEIINLAINASNFKNIDLISGTIRLDRSDKNLRDDYTRPTTLRLKEAFMHLDKKYDFVIFDNAPRNDLVVTNTLLVSDLVIVPVKCDRKSAKGFIRTIESLLVIQQRNDVDYDFRLLLQMINRNKNDSKTIDFYHEIFPEFTFRNTVRYQAKPISDADLHKQIVIDKNNVPVADDYRNVVNEVLEYFQMEGTDEK